MVRQTTVLLLALLVASSCSVSSAVAQYSSTTSLTDLIVQVEPSVVRIDAKGDQGEGIGSGFVVGSEGIVITNHHVIAGALTASVTFEDKRTARVLGTLALDKQRDVAVLKIDGSGYPALELASDLPRKGESVAAFGSPVGLSFTATEGIISSIRKSEELREYTTKAAGTWIQTSTPISPGNSGGPLVNRSGQVVGANTMTMVHAQNLNFAISSPDIAEVFAASKDKPIIPLAEGAAKEERDVSVATMDGVAQIKAIEKLTELLMVADADSTGARMAAAQLILIDPKDIDDPLLAKRVAKAFKRIAYESKHGADLGVRGMARWGGDFCIPYFAELLEMETFSGSEAVYAVLSESENPKAAEAIARRLGNFFDGDRAWAALRRMGPAAEPGLILAVSSPNPDVSLGSIKLLAKFGTQKSLAILNEAQRRGTGFVRVEAKRAASKIRTRMRKAAREKKNEQ